MIQIKSTNPRFTKGMTLNGNLLSGDTYRAKDNIKKFWDGEWDAARKVWIVNPEKVMATLNSKYNWGLAIEAEDAPKTATTHVRAQKSELCPRCGTYCYGDCSAH